MIRAAYSIVLLQAAIVPLRAADFSAFTHSQHCTLSTGTAGLSGSVFNFPLLVRLTEAENREVFENARNDGHDIRFTKADNQTPLYYEMERWDLSGADSVAEFWVLVDTVAHDDDQRYIVLHCGNSDSSTDRSADSLVFNTSNGFAGVWHLGESGAGSAGDFKDATTNRKHSTNTGYQPDRTTGIVGYGQSFGGAAATDRIEIGDHSVHEGMSELTVSVWARLASGSDHTQNYRALAKENDYALVREGSAWDSLFHFYGGSSTDNPAGQNHFLSDSLGYWSGVFKGGSYSRLFRDGAQVDESTAGIFSEIATSTDALWFGNRSTGGCEDCWWNGLLDEIRIENVARSPDWVKLCYETQKSGASVVAYGAVQGKLPTGTISIDDGAYTSDATPAITVTSTYAVEMRFQVNSEGWQAWEAVNTVKADLDVSSGGDGTKTVYAQFRNASGDTSTRTSDVTVYDATEPTSSPDMLAGYNAGSWPGAVTGSASDNEAGLDSVKITISRASDGSYWDGSTWVGAAIWLRTDDNTWSYSFALGELTETTFTVQSRAWDKAGNLQSSVESDSFVYDNAAPSNPSVAIQDDGGLTREPDPPLNLAATDGNALEMFLTTDTAGADTSVAAGWKSFASTDSITLAAEGTAYVWVMYRDIAGNASAWVFDSTVFDSTPPTSSVTTSGAYNAATWQDSGSAVKGTASDGGSGVDSVYVRILFEDSLFWDGSSWSSPTPVDLPAGLSGSDWEYALGASDLSNGTYSVEAQAVDAAGNRESPRSTGSFVFDTDAPDLVQITIEDMSGYTADADPALTLNASDVAEMRIGCAQTGHTTAWKPYATSDSIDISAAGSNTDVEICVQYRDNLGNPSPWVCDNTVYDITPPTSTILTSGTYNAASWSSQAQQRIEGTAGDASAGVDTVRVRVTNGTTGNDWNGSGWESGEVWLTAGGTTGAWQLPLPASALGDASYTVRVRARDAVGNRESAKTGGFGFDNTAPTIETCEIVDDNGYTTNLTPPVHVSASAADSMRLGVVGPADTAGLAWTAYVNESLLDVSSGGDGVKIVAVQCKDTVGNRSTWCVDTTVYDQTRPVSRVTTAGTFNPASWPDTIRGTASDATAGIDSVQVTVRLRGTSTYWDGTGWSDGVRWLDARGSSLWWVPFSDNRFVDSVEATYEVRCRAVDRAGNEQQSPSDTTFLFHQTPVADFSPGIPVTVAEGSSVEFYDSSWGTIDSWEWDFGDGQSSTEQNPAHAYSGTDTTFTVTLTVSGPGGSDTFVGTDWVFVIAPGTNPVRLTGRYLSDSTVELTYGSFQQISVDPVGFPPRKVDSLRLYTRAGAVPVTQSTGALKKSYHVPTLKQRSGDRFLDTVTVSPLTGNDSTYGFSTVLWWDNGNESEFREANGYLVLMKDTVVPGNDLTVSGAYRGGDSIEVVLDGVSTLDSSTVARVGAWYGFDQIPDFSSSGQTAWVAVPTVLEGASGDTYAWELRDGLFDGEKRELYVYVIVEGVNGLYSTDTSATFFSVGRTRPVYEGTLTASAVDAKRIALDWEAVESNVDSIVIWYDTTAIARRHDVSAPWAISPSVGTTADTVTGLSASTTYHFGLQVRREGLWSEVGRVSSASATTRSAQVGDTLLNSLTVTNVSFDSSRNEIVVYFTSDTTGVDYGITWDAHAYPPNDRVPGTWTGITNKEDSTRIALGDKIVFDAFYYVSLWMRGDGGPVEPTDSSRGEVEIGAPSWQTVTYFDRSAPRDTVEAFNGEVVLWKDSLYDPKGRIPVVGDTLVWEQVPDSGWEGMVAVSGVLRCAAPEQTPAFFVGLSYDRSKIPGGYGARDIRVYRPGASGTVSAVRTSGVDSTVRIAWVKTSDFSLPFVALVDTVRPDTAFLTDLHSVIGHSSDTIRDTVVILDNTGDLHWWLYYDRGDRALFDRVAASGILPAGGDTLELIVPGVGAEDCGIRGALVIDDGRFRDTIDVSRRARRRHSDEVTTAEMEWFPLHVTAELNEPGLRRALAGEAASTFEYNTRDMRLFRWFPDSSNKGKSDKWVEYSESRHELFEFRPGRLIWIKTAEHRSIDFGEGVTLSLQDTFSLTLPAGEWTDFGLPYRFDVRVRDIAGATGARGDSLEYYRWKRSGPRRGDSMYVTDLLYAPGISETDTMVLESGSGTANTVYNPLTQPVILRIPPIPPVMSPAIVDTGGGESKKSRNKERGWRVRVSPSLDRGPHLSTIYCGYEPGGTGTRYYAAPPSFSPLRAGVHARRTMFGHAVAREAPHGGCAFELVFRNDESGERTVRCTLDKMRVEGEAWILDPVSREWEANDDNAFSVAVKGDWSEYRWLVVGDAEYRDYFLNSLPSWRLDLMRVHTAAGGRSVLMRYSVPYGGMRSIEFAAFDAAGRLLWFRQVEGAGLQRGVHTVAWNPGRGSHGLAASGMYIVRMRAVDSDKRRRSFTHMLPLVR